MAMFPPYVRYDVPVRRTRGDLAHLGAAGAVLAVICAGMFAYAAYSTSEARRLLNPATNTTALPDGDYVIRQQASFHEAGQCWYRGRVQDTRAVATLQNPHQVTVYGHGPGQCGGPAESYSEVHITVSDGSATITGLAGSAMV
jgi:hypothetical protein